MWGVWPLVFPGREGSSPTSLERMVLLDDTTDIRKETP